MRKILVAEDDKFLASAYRMKLTKAGYEVKTAEDGEVALQVLRNFTPDLIILDLLMPRKDGFAVLAELRSSEAWKAIPCIVASNLSQKEDIEKALRMGANDYIVKTDISMNELIDKVTSLLAPPSSA